MTGVRAILFWRILQAVRQERTAEEEERKRGGKSAA
jgi:hypothetical protein